MNLEMPLHRKLIGWVLTPPYFVVFISILCVFHVFLLLAGLFGRSQQKRVLDIMNLCIIWNIRLLTGASYRVLGTPTLPEDRAVLIVSNHQSMYDIPMIMWACRQREIGFVAKQELGRWIPSISLSLRRLGSVLIDRKDPKRSIAAIRSFGARKERECQVAALFPEGTRARDGKMKKFKSTGFRALTIAMPGAIIQPIVIRGNWELLRYHFLPVPFGTCIELEFLEPFEQGGASTEALLEQIEDRIRGAVRA